MSKVIILNNFRDKTNKCFYTTDTEDTDEEKSDSLTDSDADSEVELSEPTGKVSNESEKAGPSGHSEDFVVGTKDADVIPVVTLESSDEDSSSHEDEEPIRYLVCSIPSFVSYLFLNI